jgi:predicted nucleic acid-binding Zn ribbon protein
MFEEFPTCNVCGKTLMSDANMQTGMMKYCKLCGMLIEDIGKFCCEKCERIYKIFVKRRKDEKVKKWIKQN